MFYDVNPVGYLSTDRPATFPAADEYLLKCFFIPMLQHSRKISIIRLITDDTILFSLFFVSDRSAILKMCIKCFI